MLRLRNVCDADFAAVGDVVRAFATWLNADPAADLLAEAVRPSRSVLEAADAAFELVDFSRAMSQTPILVVRMRCSLTNVWAQTRQRGA